MGHPGKTISEIQTRDGRYHNQKEIDLYSRNQTRKKFK